MQPPIERAVPGVDDVEHQRRVHADRRVQRRRRLPGAVAHARDVLAGRAGRVQRHAPAVAGDHVARVDQAAHLDLHPLDRRVDVAGRRAAGRLLAQHVPGLDRLAQLQLDAATPRSSRAAESGTRGAARTSRARTRSRPVAGRRARRAKSWATKCGSMKRSTAPVPQRTSRCGRARARTRRSARARSSCWARLMRACGGISKARSSTRPWRPVGAVRAVELVDADLGAVGVAGDVDQQVAEDAIDEPGRRRPLGRRPARTPAPARRARRGAPRRCAAPGWSGPTNSPENRYDSDGWLTPVADQAAQQIGPAQERAVGRRRAAQHHVVAAAGAGVAAVEHELLGAQAAVRASS